MTPSSNKVRELVEQWQRDANDAPRTGTYSLDEAALLRICADELAGRLPELERVEQERDRAVEALRGVLGQYADPKYDAVIDQIGRSDGGERPMSVQTTDRAVQRANRLVNLYESVTGKKLGGDDGK